MMRPGVRMKVSNGWNHRQGCFQLVDRTGNADSESLGACSFSLRFDGFTLDRREISRYSARVAICPNSPATSVVLNPAVREGRT